MKHFNLEIRWHPPVSYSANTIVQAWWEYVNVIRLPGGGKARRAIGAIRTISPPDAIAMAKEQALEVLNALSEGRNVQV
jgi:hypothetical protein